MSTRDWSEAWTAEESSVHGREAIECGISATASPAVNAMYQAQAAYRAAVKAIEAAKAALTRPTIKMSGKAMDMAYKCDDSCRPYPAWVRAEEAAVRADEEAAKAEAAEAFMDSDAAEGLVAALVAAKAALDAALEVVKAEEAAAKAADPLTITVATAATNPNYWIVVCCRADKDKVAAATGRPVFTGPSSAKDGMIATVSETMMITNPFNKDRFVLAGLIVHDPKAIKDVGFGGDLVTLLTKRLK